MRFVKSISASLFSILLFFLIIPVVFASSGGSGLVGGNFFLVITSFGIVYISTIAWYLNKRSRENEMPLEFKKKDD